MRWDNTVTVVEGTKPTTFGVTCDTDHFNGASWMLLRRVKGQCDSGDVDHIVDAVDVSENLRALSRFSQEILKACPDAQVRPLVRQLASILEVNDVDLLEEIVRELVWANWHKPASCTVPTDRLNWNGLCPYAPGPRRGSCGYCPFDAR